MPIAPRQSKRRFATGKESSGRLLDIHDTPAKIRHAYARLRGPDAGVAPEVAEAICGFVDSRQAAVSGQRALAYLEKLRTVAIRIGPNHFLRPNRETPGAFRAAFKDAEVWTQLTMRSVCYVFWKSRFEKEGTEFPNWLRIPISRRKVNQKDYTDVLTREEAKSIAEATLNPRDRALVHVLYESGGRIGEVLSLRVGDVEHREDGGYRLHFPSGKTGRRTVALLLDAVPALGTWLSHHSFRKDRTAPLWTRVEQVGDNPEVVGYRAVVKMLQKAAARAGVEKPVNPHNWRHSIATALAANPEISTAVLEGQMGWQPGSPMAAVYVHLSGRQVEDAVARAYGVVPRKPVPIPESAHPQECPRCSIENPGDSTFCSRCGGPLSLSALGDLKIAEANQAAFAELLADPKIAEYLARAMAAKVKAGKISLPTRG